MLFVAAILVVFVEWQFRSHERLEILTKDVASASECDAIIAAAELSTWDSSHDSHYLPTKEVAVEGPLEALAGPIAARVMSEGRLRELYIVKYGVNDSLAMHVDRYTASFSIALSEGFEGGGLQFDLVEEPFRVKTGTAVLFPSKLLHAALPVTNGTRYALVGLVSIGQDRIVGGDRSAKIHGMFANCVHFQGQEYCKSKLYVLYSHIANTLRLVWNKGLDNADIVSFLKILARNAAIALLFVNFVKKR